MVNHVTIGGNLVRDPELKYLPNGTALVTATIANNKKWKDANGQPVEKVVFVGINIWGKTAEAFAQWHKKGDLCLVEGELDQETWDDKDTGKKRERTKVRVERWHFMPKKDGQGAAPAPAPRAAAPTPTKAAPAPADGAPPEDADKDLPF